MSMTKHGNKKRKNIFCCDVPGIALPEKKKKGQSFSPPNPATITPPVKRMWKSAPRHDLAGKKKQPHAEKKKRPQIFQEEKNTRIRKER